MEAVSDFLPALRSADPEPGLEMDVEILLAQLPEKYRQVIHLFYLEQKAYEEVADMLGLPLGTVKTLLFRAKKELVRINARPAPAVPTGSRAVSNEPKANPSGRGGQRLAQNPACPQAYPLVTYVVRRN